MKCYLTDDQSCGNYEQAAVTQPTDTSNPSGVLHQNIQWLFSEFYNQLKKQRAIARMKEKSEKGNE